MVFVKNLDSMKTQTEVPEVKYKDKNVIPGLAHLPFVVKHTTILLKIITSNFLSHSIWW